MACTYIPLYDVAQELELVAQLQRVSLSDTEFGYAPQPLIGSAEWWQEIRTGKRPKVVVEGEIEHASWGSMGDWPEFTIRSGDEVTEWTCEGDVRRYVPGLRARVTYVEQPLKQSKSRLGDAYGQAILTIEVEDSPLRAPGVGRRPGSPPENAVHYLCFEDEQNAAAAAAQVKSSEVSTVCGRWLVRVQADPETIDETAEELTAIAREHHGWYDGGEVVGGRVWAAAIEA